MIVRAASGSITAVLESEASLEHWRPSLVIVQLGIVDCAPRTVRLWERRLLEATVRHHAVRVGRLLGAVRRRTPSRAYVSPQQFALKLRSFALRAARIGANILALPLLEPMAPMVDDCPGIVDAVRDYNRVLHDCLGDLAHVRLVDVGNAEQSWYIDDGYHLGLTGANQVHRAIEHTLLDGAERDATART